MILNEKGIIKHFDLVIYPVDFVVAIGDVKEELEKDYKPSDEQYVGFGKPTEENPCRTFEATEKETNVQCSLIWIKDLESCKGSYFCHECSHAAMDIFSYIGAKPDVENQEPFAYLIGNLFRLLNGAFYELRDYKSGKKEDLPEKF
jgi:hypothetical protein